MMQICIIGRPGDQIVEELKQKLDYLDLDNFVNCFDFEEVDNHLESHFQGFFIFCLGQLDLLIWKKYIQKRLGSYFKLYYYDSLVIEKMENFLLFDFDFINIGLELDNSLIDLIKYLDNNYWRKIPLKILKIQNHSVSNLFRNIVSVFEISEIDDINLEHISRKLELRKVVISKEIKHSINLTFKEFKNQIVDYYRKNFPEKFL